MELKHTFTFVLMVFVLVALEVKLFMPCYRLGFSITLKNSLLNISKYSLALKFSK